MVHLEDYETANDYFWGLYKDDEDYQQEGMKIRKEQHDMEDEKKCIKFEV